MEEPEVQELVSGSRKRGRPVSTEPQSELRPETRPVIAEPQSEVQALVTSSRKRGIPENAEPQFMLYVLQGRFDLLGLEMKSSLWANLPEEMLERILAVVPLTTRCRFRAVCKGWKNLFDTPRFKKMCKKVGQPPPALICALEYQPGPQLPPRDLFPGDASLLYNQRRLRSHHLSLSFLPEKFRHFSASDFVAEGGLICILRPERLGLAEDSGWKDFGDIAGMSFCVANPLTQTWKELPAEFGPEDTRYWVSKSGPRNLIWTIMTDLKWRVTLEVDDPPSADFKLTVVSVRACKLKMGQQRLAASTYFSRFDRWELTYFRDKNRRYVVPELNHSAQYIVCNGFMYIFANGDIHVHSMDDGEQVQKRSWMENLNSGGMHCARKVFEHCGRIYCVGNTTSLELLNHGIWHLNLRSLQWEYLSLLPDTLRRQVEELSRDDKRSGLKMDAADLVGNTICLVVTSSSVGGKVWSRYLLAYSISDRTWRLACPRLLTHLSAGYQVFKPSSMYIGKDS